MVGPLEEYSARRKRLNFRIQGGPTPTSASFNRNYLLVGSDPFVDVLEPSGSRVK